MPAGLTYDTGALIAADRSHRRLWALHRRALERQIVPTVPAGVLAQAWRNPSQAQLARLLKGCRVEEFEERRAKAAGVACGRAGTSDVVDAAVVVGAAIRSDIVVTSDPADLRRLAEALDVSVRLELV
jgi:hypothetical protein